MLSLHDRKFLYYKKKSKFSINVVTPSIIESLHLIGWASMLQDSSLPSSNIFRIASSTRKITCCSTIILYKLLYWFLCDNHQHWSSGQGPIFASSKHFSCSEDTRSMQFLPHSIETYQSPNLDFGHPIQI